MDDTDLLKHFISDFLTPIAADGRLEDPEQTPLIVAFNAYDIASQLERAPEHTEEQLRQAIATAARNGATTRKAADLEDAWHRILRRTASLSWNELVSLQEWFQKEAIRSHATFLVPMPNLDRISMREGPLAEDCIVKFHKWIADAVLPVQPVEVPPAPVLLAEPVVAIKDVEFSDGVSQKILTRVRRAQLHENAEEVVARLEKSIPSMLFDSYRDVGIDRVIAVPKLEKTDNLWFIGDIHGDLLGLEAALQHIQNFPAKSESRIVFLGDLIDDGALACEVVLRVGELILKHPDAICVIAGNHDEALHYDGSAFTSSVQPCDFAEWLNLQQNPNSIESRLGRVTIKLFATAPRALFLPDGLFVTHGGFPLKDLWEQIHSLRDMNDPRCLQDFVWTRASETAKTKIPNRSSKGCQFGCQDFEGFCEVANRAVGVNVSRMIRGHDHVENRYLLYSRYRKNPALVINNMCHRLTREVFGPFERTPCVARWVFGELPEVHRLHMPPGVIRTVFPESHE